MASAMVPRNAGEQRLATQANQQAFTALDNQILAGLTDIHRLATELMEMRDSKLYRVQFDTFDAYVKSRLAISASTARRLIATVEPKQLTSYHGGSSTHQNGASTDKPGSKSNKPKKPAKPEPKDPYGMIVPTDLRDGFADPGVQRLIDTLGKATELLSADKLSLIVKARQGGLPWYRGQSIHERIQHALISLDEVLAEAVNERPHAVCPTCQGKRCQDCNQWGLVSKKVYQRLKATEVNE